MTPPNHFRKRSLALIFFVLRDIRYGGTAFEYEYLRELETKFEQFFQGRNQGSESGRFMKKTKVVSVPDPGKEVCADPVNRGAILEGGGPGPPGREQRASVEPRQGKRKDVTR
jgi:hypothetical protein